VAVVFEIALLDSPLTSSRVVVEKLKQKLSFSHASATGVHGIEARYSAAH